MSSRGIQPSALDMNRGSGDAIALGALSLKVDGVQKATVGVQNDGSPIMSGEGIDFRVNATDDRAEIRLGAGSWFPLALANLTNVDAVLTGTPVQVVADCTGTGLGTNASAAMAAAINDAIARVGDGAYISFSPGRRRVGTAVIIDLGGKRDITIDLGVITPDALSLTAFTFRNGHRARIAGYILGGGRFAGWAEALPFYVDYENTQEVVGAGGCEAIRIEGISGYELRIGALGYAGRVLRTTGRSNPAYPKTIACKGSVETARFTDLALPRCAQALWADDGTETEHGNWGSLSILVNDFDYYPPVWVDLNDVTLPLLDGAYATNGPWFRGVQVLKLGDVYVGDVDGNSSNYHLQLVASGTRNCAKVTYNQMLFLNGGSGLNAVDVEVLRGGVIEMSGSALAFDTVARFAGCKSVRAALLAEGTGATLGFIEGSGSDDIVLDLKSKNQTSNHFFITSEVTGDITLNGKLEQATGGDILLIVSSTTALVRLGIVDLFSDDVTSSKLIVPATNRVYWYGGSVKGDSGDWGSTNRPLYINIPSYAAVPGIDGTLTP